ncbi:MAG: DUF72 domain-containing protein [Pseudomonadota bacterium]
MAKQLPLFPAPEAASEPARQSGKTGKSGEPRQHQAAIGPAPASREAEELGRRLPRELYLGTSSWHFPGWKGTVWDRAATESELARSGLAAYAQHPLLRSVGVDRTFYAPVPASQFAAYAQQVPAHFRFLVKAPHLVTSAFLRTEDGKPAGNRHFLDAAYAIEHFIRPCCEGLGAKAGPLLFQFSPLGRAVTRDPGRFAQRLHDFLAALPGAGMDGVPQNVLYAVELRDPELLTRALFAALKAAKARYCLGVHARMPPVAAQAAAMAGFGHGPLVVRWNLHAGYGYEQAKARYAPFDRLVEEDPATRESIARLAAATLAAGQPAFVIANNKAEGSAPLTLLKLAHAIRGALRMR